MSEQCKNMVYGDTIWSRRKQCSRKAVSDGFCRQHHPDAVKKRQNQMDAKFQVRKLERMLGYGGPVLLEALRSIRDGADSPAAIAQDAINALRLD